MDDDPVIAVARATREQRSTYAYLLLLVCWVPAVVGFFLWNSSKPDLNASGENVARAFADLENGTNTPLIRSEPIWLYLGFGAMALLIVVALILLASRPAVPRARPPRAPAIVGPPDDF